MFNWKKGVALMSVVAGVVLLSACNLFLTDNQVLQKMFERSTKVESGNINGKIVLRVPNAWADSVFTINMVGRYSTENSKNVDAFKYIYQYNVDLKASMSGLTFESDADLIHTENKLFVKINSFPMMMAFGDDSYFKTWYHFDLESLAELSGEGKDFLPFTNPNKLKEFLPDLNNFIIDGKFLTVEEDLGKIKLSEHQVYHYRLNFDKENFKKSFQGLSDNILSVLTADEGVVLSEEEKIVMFESVMQMIDSVLVKNLEVYIDSKTFDLRKFVMDLEWELPGTSDLFAEMGEEISMEKLISEISFDFTMDQFNKIKISDIELPSESEDLYQKYIEEKNVMVEFEGGDETYLELIK